MPPSSRTYSDMVVPLTKVAETACLAGIGIVDIPVTLGSVGLSTHSREVRWTRTELEVWTTPDFVEYETPMEVTAYAMRMED